MLEIVFAESCSLPIIYMCLVLPNPPCPAWDAPLLKPICKFRWASWARNCSSVNSLLFSSAIFGPRPGPVYSGCFWVCNTALVFNFIPNRSGQWYLRFVRGRRGREWLAGCSFFRISPPSEIFPNPVRRTFLWQPEIWKLIKLDNSALKGTNLNLNPMPFIKTVKQYRNSINLSGNLRAHFDQARDNSEEKGWRYN